MMENQKTKVGLRVDNKTLARIKLLAQKEHWSLSKLAEIAVQRYLDVRKV